MIFLISNCVGKSNLHLKEGFWLNKGSVEEAHKNISRLWFALKGDILWLNF